MKEAEHSLYIDHVTSTGHNLKWDHFEILAKGRSDTHCKIKETLLIEKLKPTLNDNVNSEKLYLYWSASFICEFFSAFVIVIKLLISYLS